MYACLIVLLSSGAMETQFLEENSFTEQRLIEMLSWRSAYELKLDSSICHCPKRCYARKGFKWYQKLYDNLLMASRGVFTISPLISLTMDLDIDRIKYILDHTYFFINKKNKYGQTALNILAYKIKGTPNIYSAMKSKNIMVLNLLLEAGENPYLKNNGDKSALEISANNPGLSDYMIFKYEEFKKKRAAHLIDFTIRLLSTGEKIDPTKSYGPFLKDIAELIAHERYKN